MWQQRNGFGKFISCRVSSLGIGFDKGFTIAGVRLLLFPSGTMKKNSSFPLIYLSFLFPLKFEAVVVYFLFVLRLHACGSNNVENKLQTKHEIVSSNCLFKRRTFPFLFHGKGKPMPFALSQGLESRWFCKSLPPPERNHQYAEVPYQ